MILVVLLLLALTAYFGWLAGRRWERGRIELAEAEHQTAMESRRRTTGGVRLSAMQIRR